jgi:hypothetical protein
VTPEEFQAIYPHIIGWIRQTLGAHEKRAQTVGSMGFTRLPLYFGRELLETAKVVAVDRVPVPPLSAIGLSQFAEFEKGGLRRHHLPRHILCEAKPSCR